tara:strand:+ start:618 stop:1052 length:435 start_codon:yes stop_codon:yes gene_type:complete
VSSSKGVDVGESILPPVKAKRVKKVAEVKESVEKKEDEKGNGELDIEIELDDLEGIEEEEEEEEVDDVDAEVKSLNEKKQQQAASGGKIDRSSREESLENMRQGVVSPGLGAGVAIGSRSSVNLSNRKYYQIRVSHKQLTNSRR